MGAKQKPPVCLGKRRPSTDFQSIITTYPLTFNPPSMLQQSKKGYGALPAPSRSFSSSSPRRRQYSTIRLALLPVVVLFFLAVFVWRKANLLHGLPSYEEYWLQERHLPQHNLSLAWPEGKNGWVPINCQHNLTPRKPIIPRFRRFVKFSPDHAVDFNDQLQKTCVPCSPRA